jgi:hypothetical protein
MRASVTKNPRRKTRHSKLGQIRERGQVILMVGLATLIMFGIVGLAVDVGRLYVTRVELGRALDAAALSGILELDGTTPGLTAAENKALDYFDDNEPSAFATAKACNGDASAPCNGDTNTIIMNANKSIGMIFLSVLGIHNATVSAYAKAGFGTQYLDAALVIDATSSMGDSPCNGSQNNSGCPIWEAKQASKAFKDILLGTNPSGNVGVGVAAFRGCFGRTTAHTATSPMDIDSPGNKSNCVRHDTSTSSQVSTLITNVTTLNSMIDNITATGGSGTNVCGGILKGWEVLNGTGNHNDDVMYPGNRRYVILLSDGDNRYTGTYTYQTSPYDSPHTYQTLPCRPPTSCSNVGGDSTGSNPCVSQIYTPLTTVSTDSFPSTCNNSSNTSTGWGAGSGWTDSSWTRSGSGSNAPTLMTSPVNDTSCAVRIPGGGGTICRAVAVPSTGGDLSYYVRRNSNWESTDRAYVEVGTGGCSGSFTTLRSFSSGGASGTTTLSSSGYEYREDSLNAYTGQTVYVRFRADMTAGDSNEHFYIDTVKTTTGTTASSNGYINGNDNSNNCGSSVRRERQLDILTWNVAKAMEADGVEIFVVAFGVCSSNSTTYTQAQCDSQIGNTDSDTTADQRLLKCIASSSAGSNDHYHFANSASELTAIFTKIANQIAHRLIE